MTTRKFLTSVADVYGYDNNDTLLFTGKTLLDSSIEVSLGSAPVRGGRGNQLQYIYYHTGEMKITLTDTQWNLNMLGQTVGSAPVASTNVYVEESVAATVSTLTVTATVVGTPLAYGNLVPIYGWAVTPDGYTIAGTFSGKNFTGTKVGADTLVTAEKICIRYYALDVDASYITINANMIPAIVKLVMETQLNSADVTTNKIGIVQIIVPTATLSGAFSISMKADGVANTPLSATALAYTPTEAAANACTAAPYYAKIIEIIDAANWYDNIIALSIVGGDFDLVSGVSGTLPVYAIPDQGGAFRVPDYLDLLFVSGETNAVTVGLRTGVYTGITGTGLTGVIRVRGGTGTTIDDLEAECIVTTKTS